MYFLQTTQKLKRWKHTRVAKHRGPGMVRAEPARDGGFCVFAEGVCSLSHYLKHQKEWSDAASKLIRFKSKPAQGTGSERKVAKAAKAAIPGTLGPRDYAPHP